MAGLPKKYMKMGMKKGWKAFKQVRGSKRSPIRSDSTKKKNTRSVTKIAKKRYSRKKNKPKGMLDGIVSRMGKPIGAMAYGAIRGKISSTISNSNLGQKLPVTNYTDEAVMLGAAFLARKMGLAKSGLVRSIVSNGESIEYARIGEQLVTDLMPGNNVTGGAVSASGYPI